MLTIHCHYRWELISVIIFLKVVKTKENCVVKNVTESNVINIINPKFHMILLNEHEESLKKLTLQELKKMAKHFHQKKYSTLKKNDLIKMIINI